MISPDKIPLSLYVHFPWCIKKCPYCDFNSHQLKSTDGISDSQQQRYISALQTDILNDKAVHYKNLGDRQIHSIFLGGGTPSLFSGDAIKRLLDFIAQQIPIAENCEITLEVNPGSLEHDKFSSYLDAGINRLSFGVQSFNDKHLKHLGRIHNAEAARSAIRSAQQSGFLNINLDLMYGLPDQSIHELSDDIEQALAFDTGHLSCYQLTLEPNTAFFNKPPALPNEDCIFNMQELIINELTKTNFHRYEVSGFSKPDKQSHHNINYWQFGDYLGIGAGAHAKVSGPDNRIVRSWKEKHPETYVSKIANSEEAANYRNVADNERLFEFLLNALRLKNGFNLNMVEERAGVPENQTLTALDPALQKQWLEHTMEQEESSIRCTETGYLFIDEILQSLLPE